MAEFQATPVVDEARISDGIVSETAPRPTSRESDIARRSRMLADYRVTGDLAIRDDLVREYTPLVKYLAYKFGNRGQPIEDLRQVGFIGLLKAIERYNADTGANFRTYACPTIAGEMMRYMRDKTWLVKVPRRLLEMRGSVRRAMETLSTSLGRPPRPDEIANLVKLSVEDVLEVLEVDPCWAPKSLDSPGVSENAGELSRLVESLTFYDTAYEDADRRVAIGAAMRTLTPREQTVLLLRFHVGHTQLEIGALIQVSQMQVSRILRHALDTMKTLLHDEFAPPAPDSPMNKIALKIVLAPLPAEILSAHRSAGNRDA